MIRLALLMCPIISGWLAQEALTVPFKLVGQHVFVKFTVEQPKNEVACSLFATLFDQNGYELDSVGLKKSEETAKTVGTGSKKHQRHTDTKKAEMDITIEPSSLPDRTYAVIIFAYCDGGQGFGELNDPRLLISQSREKSAVLVQELPFKKFALDNIVSVATMFRGSRDNTWWYDSIEVGCNTEKESITLKEFVQEQFFELYWHPILRELMGSKTTPITVLTDDRSFAFDHLKKFRFVLTFDAPSNGLPEKIDLNVHLATFDCLEAHINFEEKKFQVANIDGTSTVLAKHRGCLTKDAHSRTEEVIDIDLRAVDDATRDMRHIVFSVTNRLGLGVDGIKGGIFQIEKLKTHEPVAIYRLPFLRGCNALILANLFLGKEHKWYLEIVNERVSDRLSAYERCPRSSKDIERHLMNLIDDYKEETLPDPLVRKDKAKKLAIRNDSTDEDHY